MDLYNHIRKIVEELIDEESVSGDAGGYMTPRAFTPKGQKKNKATQTSEKQGMKVASGMPKHSKMFDYKELWPGKHSSMNENKLEIDVPDEIMMDLNNNGFSTLNDLFKKQIQANRNKLSTPTKLWIQSTLLPKIKQNKIEETIQKIINHKLINEVSYTKFKKDVSYRSKNEILHKGIKEVKRKLQEIDRIVEYTTRMKQELSEGEGLQYWNRTEAQLHQIAEMANILTEKINKLK